MVALAALTVTSVSGAVITDARQAPVTGPVVQPVEPAPGVPLPPAPTVRDMLAHGVVIVVSKASQRMYVYRDGVLWNETPVSTGKRGHSTPAGVFAILQKRVKHRSNLYGNAPMPYMQRLTWTGIALHAGHVPGYPASHGCIRMSRAFAAELYKITGFDDTAVIVVDERVQGAETGLHLAAMVDSPVPFDGRRLSAAPVRLAAKTLPQIAPVAPPSQPVVAPRGEGQTIQLAAALSPEQADAHWDRLVRTRPELSEMTRSVQTAMVNGRRYYRLRATAPGAHAVCGNLKRSGMDCFAVI